MNECRRCLVSGRVQGVFFRASTREVALSLGLTGSAVNLPGGQVEVVACGAREDLDRLCAWLHRGPAGARVAGVTCEEIPERELHGFVIR